MACARSSHSLKKLVVSRRSVASRSARRWQNADQRGRDQQMAASCGDVPVTTFHPESPADRARSAVEPAKFLTALSDHRERQMFDAVDQALRQAETQHSTASSLPN